MPGSAASPSSRSASFPERLLGFAERSHGRAVALLLALSLLCFVPGLAGLQPMDRDEPRFAQATKQMLETGDYVDIRFQDEVRYKKPVGIHWLQAASVRAAEALGLPAARDRIAAYRLPSLLGALAAVLLTYWAALAFVRRREAVLAAALMGSSLILCVEAHLAKTDAVLLACSVAAMGALARVWLARGLDRQPGRTVVIFWVAVAAGIMIKGPMVPMFAGLAALALSVKEGSGRWLVGLRPGLGLLFVLLVVSPWFAAIAWKSGGAFYRLAVGDDMLGKVVTGQQNHFAPPGFYLLAVFATFWPGAALAILALPAAWRERGEDRLAFLFAWIIPSWVVFEAVPTKLPHYVMPLYPALAILVAWALARDGLASRGRIALALLAALPLIPIGLAVAIGWGGWALDGRVPVNGVALLAASGLVAAAGWLAYARGEVVACALLGIGAAVPAAIGVFGFAQADLAALRLSPRLAAAVAGVPCGGRTPSVATLGYREPSLVFLLGTDLAMQASPAETASFLDLPGCRVALVDSRLEPAFAAALVAAGRPASRVAEVAGFNINGGRRTTIGIHVGSRP